MAGPSAAIILQPIAKTTSRVDWHAPLPVLALMILDFCVVALAFAIAVAFWSLVNTAVDVRFYAARWPVLILLLSAYAAVGLYRTSGLHPVEELRLVVLATAVAFLIFMAAAFLMKDSSLYSRGISLVAWGNTTFLLPIVRGVARRRLGTKHWFALPVAVLGAGAAGSSIVDLLQRRPELGFRPVAMFDDDPRRQQPVHGVPVVDGVRGVRNYIFKSRVNSGIVALADFPSGRLTEVLQEQAAYFRTVIVIPDLFGVSSLWVKTTDIGGILGLEYRDNLLQPLSRFAKRVLDLLLLLPLAALVVLLAALIAAAIKLTSSGPAFYGQLRVGLKGKLFKVWKFRTMVANADEVLEGYLSQNLDLHAEWQGNQKLRCDPRITPVGRFLRRTSLDELPQLWNVVLGQMSFVGPRPIVSREVSKYGATYRLYSRVTPGITGLWQVSGRNNTTYEARVRFDEYYVRNWSVWLDIYILARTVRTVLTADGAY